MFNGGENLTSTDCRQLHRNCVGNSENECEQSAVLQRSLAVLKRFTGEVSLVQILQPFTEDLLNVAHLLDSLMDEEEMRVENRFTVKSGIMEELDKSETM